MYTSWQSAYFYMGSPAALIISWADVAGGAAPVGGPGHPPFMTLLGVG